MKFNDFLTEASDLPAAVKILRTLVSFADNNNTINLTGDLGKAVSGARKFLINYRDPRGSHDGDGRQG